MYDNTINLDKILLSPLKKHSTKTNTKSNNKNYKHKLLNNGKNGKNNNKSITNNRISTNNDKRTTNMKINNDNNYIIITINGDLSDGATVECTGMLYIYIYIYIYIKYTNPKHYKIIT